MRKPNMSERIPLRSVLMVHLAATVVFASASAALGYDPLNGDFTRANPLDIRIVAYNHNRSFIENSSKDAAFNRILIALDPDLISFEEFTSGVSQADVANRLNSIIPIGGSGWQIHFGLLGGIRTVLASRFPLTMTRIDTIPASSTRGVTIALADLPNADYPLDVYLLGVHLKCCGSAGGSEDQKRQASADAITNWLADARGVARPSGDNVALPANTPMIILGDFNMVGGPQPENTFITGNIQDQATYGPPIQTDWDVSDLTNLMPADPFTGDTFTWQGNGSFPPSALDRFIYTDSAITVANSFVLNTNTMSNAALNAAGLQSGDTLPSNTSDHLPIVMDLSMGVDPCALDTDGDGTPDCMDGCPLDPNKIAPGICGCGTPDTDTDGDGTPDCIDNCPLDPNKINPGLCGCGTPDTDTDGDGTPDCNDLCPLDPNKINPGQCGCGVPDTAPDGDLNADTVVNGRDIERFVDALVNGPATQSDLCHGNFDGINGLDPGDITGMVNALLTAP